jgi:hypothetical protein
VIAAVQRLREKIPNKARQADRFTANCAARSGAAPAAAAWAGVPVLAQPQRPLHRIRRTLLTVGRELTEHRDETLDRGLHLLQDRRRLLAELEKRRLHPGHRRSDRLTVERRGLAGPDELERHPPSARWRAASPVTPSRQRSPPPQRQPWCG